MEWVVLWNAVGRVLWDLGGNVPALTLRLSESSKAKILLDTNVKKQYNVSGYIVYVSVYMLLDQEVAV